MKNYQKAFNLQVANRWEDTLIQEKIDTLFTKNRYISLFYKFINTHTLIHNAIHKYRL